MSSETRPEVIIRPAVFPTDKPIVSELFLAYAQSLPISLDFQNFEHELAELPGKYAVENGGAIYLACKTSSPSASDSSTTSSSSIDPEVPQSSQSSPYAEEQVIGCIAIRAFPTSNSIPTCELKRLYLTPESRGLGVSKLLLDLAIQQARQSGYKEMLLDTLSNMTAAKALYKRYGFEEIGSYYESVEDAAFYRLVL